MRHVFGLLVLLAGAAQPLFAQLQAYAWDQGVFAFPGPGTDGSAVDSAWYQPPGGGQPVLLVCGYFSTIGTQPINNLAIFDGQQWSEFPNDTACACQDLLVVPGQDGDELYMASGCEGEPLTRIGHWTGSEWETFEPNAPEESTAIGENSLAMFDDGNGPTLYIAGRNGGVYSPTSVLKRWNGAFWEPVPGAPPWADPIFAFDDGNGPRLYVSDFSGAGVLRWDGAAWETMNGWPAGEGADAFAVLDLGDGPRLYGACDVGVFRWDGQSWSGIGNQPVGRRYALATHTTPEGQRWLVASGSFADSDYPGVTNALAWDGTSWFGLDPLVGRFGFTLTETHFAGTSGLFMGGRFRQRDANDIGNVAFWNGDRWVSAAPGTTRTQAPVESVNISAVFDDGTGPALFVGGGFERVGDLPAEGLARWDGTAWQAVPGWEGGAVYSLHVHDDGRGPALYVGGSFGSAGGITVSNLARWDGQTWEDVGGGLVGAVQALQSDWGTNRLLAAAAGNGVWRWDGMAWTELDGLVGGPVFFFYDLEWFDDGNGPVLHVATNGVFRHVNDEWERILTRRNENLGVFGLATFDDGTGAALYAAGDFDKPSFQHFAKWDGQAWQSVGYAGGRLENLEVVHLGGRSHLALFTYYGLPGPVTLYDGHAWTALAESGGAAGGTVFQDALYAHRTARIDGRSHFGLARFSCQADADGDGRIDAVDLVLVLKSFGACESATPDPRADLNGDGCVDLGDLALVLRSYGLACEL